MRRQEALGGLEAFPGDVLARATFPDTRHSVAVDLDPHGLGPRTLRRAMLQPLPEWYGDAVEGQ